MADDIDSTGSSNGDTDALTAAVVKELRALRGAHGKLTLEKFSRYPVLHHVCGGSTVLDAYLVFERHLERTIKRGDQYAVAAAISLSAEHDTVTARFNDVLTHVDAPDGPVSDQRTARRWSDQGMRTIATDLVHLGDVQLRLGSELIEIALSGSREAGIAIVLWQFTTRYREERAPLVRLGWIHTTKRDEHHDQDVPTATTTTYDLDQVPCDEGGKGPFRLRHFEFPLDIPEKHPPASITAGDGVYRITIEGRDAPLRAVSFQDDSDLSPPYTVKFTASLTDATIEITKAP
ncbi:MAG: hypothetical protein QM753_05860 [Thermomicrobiales bacterium]